MNVVGSHKGVSNTQTLMYPVHLYFAHQNEEEKRRKLLVIRLELSGMQQSIKDISLKSPPNG